MRNLVLTVFILLSQTNAKAENTFYWKWQLLNDKIQITGSINNEKSTIVYSETLITKSRFSKLYYTINEIEYSKLKVYLKIVDTLSNQLVNPFDNELEKCQSIIVEIDSSLLNFAIEFLNFRNQSIALYRPIVFTINDRQKIESRDTLSLTRGFIVRDPTSDPENACRNIYRQYPTSEFKSAFKIYDKDLVQKSNIDFILISAHGDADSLTFKGGVGLNKIDNVNPYFFKINNPKIVYIDACQQGINWTYINALSETTETNYYLGPLVSNDSGESSTKTINWFFSYLRKTHNPIISLWETRKRLYNHYNKKIKTMDVINKSFIFRIYKV
jgi:hypothetical protein